MILKYKGIIGNIYNSGAEIVKNSQESRNFHGVQTLTLMGIDYKILLKIITARY